MQLCRVMVKDIQGYVYSNVLYSYRFYIYQKVLFILVKNSSGYICENILYTMRFIFITKVYLS